MSHVACLWRENSNYARTGGPCPEEEEVKGPRRKNDIVGRSVGWFVGWMVAHSLDQNGGTPSERRGTGASLRASENDLGRNCKGCVGGFSAAHCSGQSTLSLFQEPPRRPLSNVPILVHLSRSGSC